MTQPTRPPTCQLAFDQPAASGKSPLARGSRFLMAALLLAGCSATLEGSAPEGTGNGLPQRGDASMVPLDAGTPPPARDAGGDASGDQDAADAGGCHVPGRFAICVAFDVAWAGTSFAGVIPIISSGEGELS